MRGVAYGQATFLPMEQDCLLLLPPELRDNVFVLGDDSHLFKCPLCGKGLTKYQSLQEHINRHNGIQPYKCQYCDSAFTTSSMNYISKILLWKFPNIFCKKIIMFILGELRSHVRYRHTHDYFASPKKKRHHCTECDYSSLKLNNLRGHLKWHTFGGIYQVCINESFLKGLNLFMFYNSCF